MNLFSYIDKYSCYTFQDVEFNELDNAVFAAISYLNLEGYVSSNRYNKKTIREVGTEFFKNYTRKEKNVFAVRQAIKMFRYIKDTRRYGDLFLYNYIYKSGDVEQFSAVTIEINSKLIYVSFEGTDHLISGWREDFMMSYMFPVISQRRAIDYINKNFLFRGKKIILGGHSKGGNLAVVAGMYANFLVRDKIIKIYNNDGPGLLKEQFESKQYQSIKEKIVHIVPDSSVVGLLLLHDKNYKVIKSFKKGLWAHDLFTWVVHDKEFMKSKLNSFNELFEDELIDWLNKYDRDERKRFVDSLFDIFDRAKVDSLVDIMENKKLILNLIMESRELEDVDRKILRDLLRVFLNCFKDVKIDEIKSLFDKK